MKSSLVQDVWKELMCVMAQPHMSSPRAAEQQDLCHLCSHLPPLKWDPLGIQRATSCERPKGPRVGGEMCLKAAQGELGSEVPGRNPGMPCGCWEAAGALGGLAVPELLFLTRICHSTPH